MSETNHMHVCLSIGYLKPSDLSVSSFSLISFTFDGVTAQYHESWYIVCWCFLFIESLTKVLMCERGKLTWFSWKALKTNSRLYFNLILIPPLCSWRGVKNDSENMSKKWRVTLSLQKYFSAKSRHADDLPTPYGSTQKKNNWWVIFHVVKWNSSLKFLA